jgi:glycosyltransferase involved in cell wall biosynthesis
VHIFVIPSWYPSPSYPIAGIFVKEEIEYLTELHPEYIVSVSLDNSAEFNLNAKNIFSLFKLLVKYIFTVKVFQIKQKNNLFEFYKLKMKWPTFIFNGNLNALFTAHRDNFIRATERFGKPVLIHAHVTYPAGWIAMKLANEFNVPYIIKECMGPFPFKIKRFITNNGNLTDWIRKPLENANASIAMSPQLADQMASYGLKRPIVAPYPIDERRFVFSEKSHEANVVFFTLCALSDQKGVRDLLTAIPYAISQRNNLRFVIAGTGNPQEYMELAEELGVTDAIVWLGSVAREQVPMLFAQADAFIMLSHLETFGMVYAEAIASGKPVIATKCGGPEFIINDINGILVNVGDVGQIVNAIVKMHDELHTYNSTNIREDFINRFSRISIIKIITDCYNNVLNINKPIAKII